eukprot:gene24460-26263_t
MIGPTLGRYLLARFARTVLGVFMTIFALIYLVDLIEMLRRAGSVPNATALTVAWLCLLRVPAISEQVLPFAVLGGSMIAFVALTRRLELVVARAAGVSVWQFLSPPLVAVLLIGIAATTLYTPLGAIRKDRADQIETTRLGRRTREDSDTSMWIRQRSIDGQSIVRAERPSDKGTVLSGISTFVFDPEGRFVERIEAARAKLWPGFWQLEDARISAVGEEPQAIGSYMLATNLTPEQVSQSFGPADNVPFWELRDLSVKTEAAGLDATSYRLRFQSLLARPLLLAAMVLVAACFSLRFFRFGGISKMVTGGVVSGFVLYVATKLVGDLGGAGLLSTPVAAWSPAIVGTMLGTLVLLHQEDG